jgi:hypothetical protein
MTLKSNEVKIYAPDHFKATWRKFLEICERDGQSASELVRIWVEGYVQRKDPGNPQRPLTAWTPGHEDQEALALQEVYDKLLRIAEDRGGDLEYRRVLGELSCHLSDKQLATGVDEMAWRLQKAGVKVWR